MPNEIIKGCRVHHAALEVTDFDRSVKFYKDMGFTAALEWYRGNKKAIMMDTGEGSCLELFDGGIKEGIAKHQAGDILHIAFLVDNADDAYNTALKCGAMAKSAPMDCPTKVRIAFVYGPDGEEIEFFQHIKA